MNDRARWIGIRALAITIACAVAALAVYSYGPMLLPEVMIQSTSIGVAGLTLVIGGAIIVAQWHKGRNQPQNMALDRLKHHYSDDQMSADELLQRYQISQNQESENSSQQTQEVMPPRKPVNGKTNEEQVKDQLAKMVMETISKSKLEISMTGTIDQSTFSPQVKKMKFKLTSQGHEAAPTTPEKPKPKEEKKPVLRRQA